jgi:ubiquinone/menaquinone biosynthesis C-methylase UbiE
VSALPCADESFDRIFSINSFQFWSDPIRDLEEPRRVLKPAGLIAIAVQARWRGATEEAARETGELLVASLSRAGFASVRLEVKSLECSGGRGCGRAGGRRGDGGCLGWVS